MSDNPRRIKHFLALIDSVGGIGKSENDESKS
jgi:hypothetical protein